MSVCLGIDTSNYTTSAAIYDSVTKTVLHRKKLLPVKTGEKGLRQSDAVFHHTVALPLMIEELFEDYSADISAVGVSARPRDAEGSYMPCFLAGASAARSIAAVGKIPLYNFSHQAGHIAAALYSAGKLSLLRESFIAFHVSGGTTEVLLVKPDKEKIFQIEIIGKTLDLNAGQVIDRVGVMLGLPFPSGAKLDILAGQSKKSIKIKPYVADGNCSLSGLENKCISMFSSGESAEDISRYCIEFIAAALEDMAQAAIQKYGPLPLLFSGGVMANSIIRQRFTEKFGAAFAEPEFSSDNAAGIALLTSLSA